MEKAGEQRSEATVCARLLNHCVGNEGRGLCVRPLLCACVCERMRVCGV